MVPQALPEVCCVADITPVRLTQALEHVGVEHGLPSIAWNPIGEKSSFAKPMEDILRLEPSHSLGFQAKDGGPPRCRPVLCGLRDRCIAAMLATQRDRDAKAELNRRGQACEIPG